MVPKIEEGKIGSGWKARKPKIVPSLVQGNNEKGKKVMWDPHIKPFHANVNGKIEKQPIFV